MLTSNSAVWMPQCRVCEQRRTLSTLYATIGGVKKDGSTRFGAIQRSANSQGRSTRMPNPTRNEVARPHECGMFECGVVPIILRRGQEFGPGVWAN